MSEVASTSYIFDASALIAYLKGEPGGEVVQNLLLEAEDRCFAHAVNICEVYYYILAAAGEATADQAMGDMSTDGLLVREDLDHEFLVKAAHYKVDRQVRPPIADCFCMVLAERIDGEIVTGDHPDFDALAASGVCRVRFIR